MEIYLSLTERLLKNNFEKYERTTAVLRKGGCSASIDSFVVGSSAVLRLNFSAKNPPLRKATKRWWQVAPKLRRQIQFENKQLFPPNVFKA